jgi:hypothetical protein
VIVIAGQLQRGPQREVGSSGQAHNRQDSRP